MAAASRSPSPTKMPGGSRLSPTEHQKTAPSLPPVPKLLTVELILRTWQALGMKRVKENEYIRVDEKIFVPVDPDAAASATSAAATTANATGRCAGSGAGRDRRAAAATATAA